MSDKPTHPYLQWIRDTDRGPTGHLQILIEAEHLPVGPRAAERLREALDAGIVLAVCARDEATLTRAAHAIALAVGLIDCLPVAVAQ